MLVEVLLLNFTLIRVIPMLPAEPWGHLMQLGNQGSVATSGFVWLPPGLFTLADGMGLFLGIKTAERLKYTHPVFKQRTGLYQCVF